MPKHVVFMEEVECTHEEYSVLGTVLNCSLQAKNCLNSCESPQMEELIIPIIIGKNSLFPFYR